MQKPRWKLESFDETLKVQIGGVGDKFINFFFFFFFLDRYMWGL